jgi:hypothetical protein
MNSMPYLIGIVLALAVSAYATALGLDRDRAFYPTVLMVIAAYYVLFAAMGGSGRVVIVESVIVAVFVVAASLGFRRSLWLVVAGLAAHGVMDLFHQHLVANPGVPSWWPAFCSAYDVAAAGYLAWRLTRDPARRLPIA